MAIFEQIAMEMDIEQYASKEELMFSHYVKELIDAGYLNGAKYQPPSFELSPETSFLAAVTKKNKEEDKSIKVLNEHSYQADWRLFWNIKSEGTFYWQNGGSYQNNFFPYRKSSHDAFVPFYASLEKIDGIEQIVSTMDIKGAFVGRNNTSGITFPLNQKWTMKQHGVFVQKVVISLDVKGLFYRTFTPRQVIVDEVYKKDYVRNNRVYAKAGDSKLKYKPILLEQFIKNKTK
jgi:hypothetical protein